MISTISKLFINILNKIFMGILLVSLMLGLAHAANLQSITPEDAGYDSSKLVGLSDELDALYEDGLIPNYVIAVAKGGEVFYSAYKGSSRVETNNSVNLNTIYPLASMTKPFVSVAIMRLVEEGKLNLNSELSEFYPQFENMFVAPGGSLEGLEEANRQITILDLLTHTSGLTYGSRVTGEGDVARLYDELGIGAMNKCISTDENLEVLSQIPLIAQPGAEWNYSVGLDVLGAVIEVVTGESLGDYLEEIIFSPLNMSATSFTLSDEDLQSNWAMIYGLPSSDNPAIGEIEGSEIDWKISEVDRNPAILDGTFASCPIGMTHDDERFAFYSGGGGIHGSANDYLTFMLMIMNGGQLNGTKILSESSIDFMLSEQVSVAYPAMFGNNIFGAGFGINLQVDDPSEIDFYRWGGAFNTGFWMDPLDNSVGVVFSSHWPGRYNRGNAIEQRLDDARIAE